MGKVKDLLYSTALNSAGELIPIDTAETGQVYACPICQGQMIPRKGEKKRHHFAHKALTDNCTPESVLHYSFKRMMAQKIEAHIASQEPLRITWGCRYCLEIHTGNLIKKTARVEFEYDLGSCRPDIALLDASGKVIAVIEVVVTHEPEPKVIDYYEQQKIGLVIFRLKSEADLSKISSSMDPDDVQSCLNPTCKRCGCRTNRKDLVIIQSRCKWCQQPMRVAATLSKGCHCGDFFPSDLKLAEQNGVQIGYWNNKKSNWLYPTSACPSCRGVVGTTWLWDEHVNPDLDLPREVISAGHVCGNCEIDLEGARKVYRRSKPACHQS
jgi:ssDNA-binding Zn-finger/Zn-ribbon topoisomerase 1